MSAFSEYPRITPFLWFDSNAEEAADFYCGIFPNSRRLDQSAAPSDDSGSKPKTNVLTVAFELDGQKFTALNGGPMFKFNEAISLVVRCESQAEVDFYWEKLAEGGGKPGQCGWLKDKFGVSWQITPVQLIDLIKNPKAMQAMLKMTKIEIAEMERAAAE